MPERIPDRDVLLRLAEGLPDTVLQDLAAGVDPAAIRALLRRLADEQQPAAGKKHGDAGAPSALKTTKSCLLYSDGASRGNPGEAGAGIVLLDDSGRDIAVRSIYLGQCTNNSAEYQALITGLELAGEHGCRELKIFLDSELIVRQLNGSYRVKNAQLQVLFDRTVNLLQHFKKWQIEHVPRAENARADQLANQGIDDRN